MRQLQLVISKWLSTHVENRRLISVTSDTQLEPDAAYEMIEATLRQGQRIRVDQNPIPPPRDGPCERIERSDEDLVRKKQSKFIGHILRKGKLEHTITIGKVLGRRDRGSQREKLWTTLQNGMVKSQT